MSHAPVRRKSQQAMAARIANAASRKPAPAPHRVVLRVKRKRGDAAVENLLVATDEGGAGEEEAMPGRKRRATGIDSVEETMAELSLNRTVVQAQPELEQLRQDMDKQSTQRPRLVYKRVRTTEPDYSSDRTKEGRSSTTAIPPPRPHESSDGGVISTSGGRLDALLSSRGFNAPAFAPPPPAAILDYMEVRRVKARAVSGRDISNTIAADPSARGMSEQAASNGVVPAAASRAAVAGAHDFHVIDLQAVGRSDQVEMDTSGIDGEAAARGGAIGGAATGTAERRTAAPILTPVERQMDEAIFKAFKTGDLSPLRNILTTSSSLSPTSVNYRRRLGDATTALMAAAFHGDLGCVRHLLSLGAKASLVDASGKSASLFAGMRGHRECFAAIQRVADEEEHEERARSTRRHASAGETAGGGVGVGVGGGGGGVRGAGDFVYDVYYFEPPTPGASALPSAAGKDSDKVTMDVTDGDAPVVRLSGIGPVDENAVGATPDVELEFEYDSDRSELGDGEEGEDPDSNSEGYYGNDYPEDEGDDGNGATSYVYDDGAGSSLVDGDSSSDGGDGFDSDSDMEPYSRMVVDMKDEFSSGTGDAGDGLGF
ncbi:unnamed protein product [Scytosiphon promiscuus]